MYRRLKGRSAKRRLKTIGRRAQRGDSGEMRENVLRPCPYLGYDRDQLALYLMNREAYEIAEAQLRRAIYINPYEKLFKIHLAECLCRMHRYTDAREWAVEVLQEVPSDPDCHRLLEAIDKRLAAECPHLD